MSGCQTLDLILEIAAWIIGVLVVLGAAFIAWSYRVLSDYPWDEV